MIQTFLTLPPSDRQIRSFVARVANCPPVGTERHPTICRGENVLEECGLQSLYPEGWTFSNILGQSDFLPCFEDIQEPDLSISGTRGRLLLFHPVCERDSNINEVEIGVKWE